MGRWGDREMGHLARSPRAQPGVVHLLRNLELKLLERFQSKRSGRHTASRRRRVLCAGLPESPPASAL